MVHELHSYQGVAELAVDLGRGHWVLDPSVCSTGLLSPVSGAM